MCVNRGRKVSSFEMLEAMTQDTDLRRIPVVMCSGSTRERDKERSRSLGAIGYLIKPVRFEHLRPMIAKAPGTGLPQEDAAGPPVLMRKG
jgi:CheY-like chemotaxis protein